MKLPFRKNRPTAPEAPYPGQPELVEGKELLERISQLSGAFPDTSADGQAAYSRALTGQRSAAIIPAQCSGSLQLPESSPLAPFVIFQGCRHRHEPYFGAVPQPGLQLFAAGLQELADLSLIARYCAERTLLPSVIGFEEQFAVNSLQTILMPDQRLISQYLGDAGDMIDSPTPAQQLIFGKQRRRIPRLISMDRPLGLGTHFQGNDYFKNQAAQQVYFYSHVGQVLEEAFREFARLTGRLYTGVEGWNWQKADYLVIAQGMLSRDLKQVADYFTAKHKTKVGVVQLRAFRPFPAELLMPMMAGKKALTILEQGAAPETLYLTRRLQSLLEDSVAATKPGSRPAIYSGIYGADLARPSFADLVAMIENMLPGGRNTRRYFLGVNFKPDVHAFPKLEAEQQQLNRAYPDREQTAVHGNAAGEEHLPPTLKIQLRAYPTPDFVTFNGIFARVMALQSQHPVHSFLEEHAASAVQPEAYSIILDKSDSPDGFSTAFITLAKTNALLAEDPGLLPDFSSLADQAGVIISTPLSARELWETLSDEQREQINRRGLRLCRVDAQQIAREIVTVPGYLRQLVIQVMIGAFIKSEPGLDEAARKVVLRLFRQQLKEKFGASHFLVEDIIRALKAGIREAELIDPATLPPFQEMAVQDPEPPWTVSGFTDNDDSLYDLARFWNSVGYLYEKGQARVTFPDPHLAAGALPARTSAFHDMTSFRSHLPHLIPENCTACGVCWSQCPDSALPPTIQDIASLIGVALEIAKNRGASLIQFQRINDPLSKQCTRLFAKDELHQYRTLGALLEEGFRHLLEKMGLDEEKQADLRSEFNRVLEIAPDYPLARTEMFFTDPEKARKGSGKVFSITVNPFSCKNCGQCIELCPENALERVQQTPDLVKQYRQNWRFQMALPEVPQTEIEPYIDPETQQGAVYRLLNKQVYYTLPGGDGAYPGSGVKTAIRLITAAAEATMQPRIDAFLQKIETLMNELEAKIQGRVQTSLHINDFEEFSRRLDELKQEELSPEALASLISEEKKAGLDARQSRRLNKLLKELKEIHRRFGKSAAGNPRSRMAFVVNPGDALLWGLLYPYNPFPYPWLNVDSGNIAGAAQGLYQGLTQTMAEHFAVIRQAELEQRDEYNPKEHDAFFAQFDSSAFNEEEREMCPPVCMVCDAASLNRHVLGGISEVLSGSLPIKILVINTLSQLESASRLSGAAEFGLWAMSHYHGYVLQSTPGNPDHLINGAMTGFREQLPALFHIYAAEPHIQGLLPNQAARQEALVIGSRTFPMFVYNPAVSGTLRDKISLRGNPEVESDWACRKIAASAPGQPPTQAPITFADWAVNEGRFREEFTPLPPAKHHPDMLPLSDFLAASPEERAGKQAYIQVENGAGKTIRLLVSDWLIRESEAQLERWRFLQEIAAIKASLNRELVEQIEKETLAGADREKQALEQEYRQKLAELEQQHFQIYHQRLSQKLFRFTGAEQDAEYFKRSLSEYLGRLARENNHDGE